MIQKCSHTRTVFHKNYARTHAPTRAQKNILSHAVLICKHARLRAAHTTLSLFIPLPHMCHSYPFAHATGPDVAAVVGTYTSTIVHPDATTFAFTFAPTLGPTDAAAISGETYVCEPVPLV